MEVSNQQFKAYLQWVRSKGKGKLHPRTGHEGPEGEQMYSSTLSLTLALNGGGRSDCASGMLKLC